MAVRVEVGFRDGVRDPRGERVVREAREMARIHLQNVRTLSVYTVDVDLSPEELVRIASGPFTDPVIQEFSIGKPLPGRFDFILEVGFKPGVTDNVGRSAGEAVSQVIGRSLAEGEGVYSSIQYRVTGNLDERDARRLVSQVLSLIHI